MKLARNRPAAAWMQWFTAISQWMDVVVVEYQIRNREAAGSTFTWSASNIAGQLSLLPSTGRKMSSSLPDVGYMVKA